MKHSQIMFPLMVALLAAVFPPASQANTININGSLKNPGFEVSQIDTSCPIGWQCGGGGKFGVYTPTSAQYTPGSDGLPGNQIIPNGNQVAYTPVTAMNSGSLWQSTSLSYVFGNTYTYYFWVGHPATSSFVPTLQVDWTLYLSNPGYLTDSLCSTNNGSASLIPIGGHGSLQTESNDGKCMFTIPDPGAGQWQEYELTYTPNSTFSLAGDASGTKNEVGVLFQNLPDSQNHYYGEADLDSTPEPSSLILLGSGLLTLAGTLRRKFLR